MKKLGRIIIVAVLAIAMMLLVVTPAHADTLDPDSDPTIDRINNYQWVLENGDWLLLIYANIPYATPPDTAVTQTFIWELIDIDGVTNLGTTLGTNHTNSGYGYNLYSMYFTATEVSDKGMVWLNGYTVRLSGNPTVFDDPPVYNFPVNADTYSIMATKADTQAELAARILTLAADLDEKWALAVAYSLLLESEAGTSLSIFGQAFFRGAIFGLQAMAPAAFPVVIRELDIEPRDWDPEYSENVTAQWAGTWVETSTEAGKALFGTDWDLLSVMILLAMGTGLMVGNVMITGDHWNGFIDIGVLAVIGARLGMYDMGIMILAASMCMLYISAKVWFGFIK